MAERRSYRTEAPAAAESPPERQAPRQEPQRSKPTYGGGKSKSHKITGLFLAKSGKADTVFVNADILAKLREVQEGDTLAVSENEKSKRLELYYYEGRG